MSHNSYLENLLNSSDGGLVAGSGSEISPQETQAAIQSDFQATTGEDGSTNVSEDAASPFALLGDQAAPEYSAADSFETSVPDASQGSGSINVIGALTQETNAGYPSIGFDVAPSPNSGFTATTNALFSPAASAPTPVVSINLPLTTFAGHGTEAVAGASGAEAAVTHPTAYNAAADMAASANPENLPTASPVANSAVGSSGATAAQVQQALDESGLSVNGTGVKVGVLSDSFNDLGGAAADEADGALPSASNVQILSDLSSGGTDEGRAMMQIVHDIAPGASLAFYTASDSEQAFANGILALAAAGCKVICDDVSYLDEPFFQNGIVAQAIQTVEAEGVTYVTSAGNNASNAYQAAWTPGSGSFDGWYFNDAELFGGSLAQTITVTASSSDPVPLLLEWNEAYGQASFSYGQAPDIDMFIFHNGSLIGQATNASVGEPNNPFTGYEFTASGTYQIVIANNFGPDPGLIKEILFGDGLPETIDGANAGTVFGHAMTPGVITAGAVSAADTPAFGFNPVSETFSSSGADTELLFANNGTPLSSPDVLNPVAVSGIDDIATTVSGGLRDFYGTSAASASLAGVAALILSADPNLTAAQVEAIMEQTALPMSNSAVSGAGLAQVDPAVDTALLDSAVVIHTDGTTSLAEAASSYFLDAVGSGSIGPYLKYDGAPVTAGEFGTWVPYGAIQVAGGYDVAWKDPGANQYTVWNTDSNGNLVSFLVAAVPGNNLTLESLETAFQQDLNGDGTIGLPPPTILQTDGTTSLAELASNFFLDTVGSTNLGPQLKYNGAPVTAGEFGSWVPFGAIQVTGGYDVAWENPGANQYTVWNTDSNGNLVSFLVSAVPGSNTTLESLESVFQQDLNGDGTIGFPPATVLQTDGTTSLAEMAENFFLNTVGSTGLGPELKYAGAPVASGEFGSWVPYGAIQVGGGYDVAWKNPGANQYTVWSTDGNGNEVSFLVSAAPGNSATLEALETTFHQDLNGDGTIGPPTTVIQTDGTTSLVEIGPNYFLNTVGSGTTGPELKYNGAPVSSGDFGSWVPYGAIEVGGGYDVAWKNPDANQYTVWSTDSDGNLVSFLVAAVPGNNAALESLETIFNQDLNGDGTIGIPAVTSPAAAQLAQVSQTSFDGRTLTLDAPSAFSGQLVGFGGDGTLAGADQVDLRGFNFTTLHTSFNSTSGTLSLSSGSSAASLQFLGQYSQDSFHFADDGNGGTLVIAATPAPQAAISNEASTFTAHDTFVFAPNFGNITLPSFAPATDTLQFSKTVFANVTALLAATHDDSSGNAVITDAAHDTITLQHVTTAQLIAHQSDFHFV